MRKTNSYSVKEAKETIKDSIQVYLKKNGEGTYIMDEVNRLPFFLVGAPGIGKTQMCSQIAEELGIGFVSCSITHHSRNTVLGLPLITPVEIGKQEEKYTKYTMSELIGTVYEQVAKGYGEGILLIDEFNCMADSLVAPMLAFLQTKNIGTFTLPEGWVMILASNPGEYNKHSRKFDTAIMDRVRVMHIALNSEEFIAYASKKDFHPAIVSFLTDNQSFVHRVTLSEESGKDDQIVTGRGWENLSHCLKGLEKLGGKVDRELIAQFIKDDEIADEFSRYYSVYEIHCSDHILERIREERDSEKVFEECRNYTEADQWKLSHLLYDTLHRQCACGEEDGRFLNYMKGVASSLNNCANPPFEMEGTEYRIMELIEQRLMSAKQQFKGPSGMPFPGAGIFPGCVGWNQEAEPRELEALNEIVLEYNRLCALGDISGNETALKAIDRWKENFTKKMTAGDETNNEAIANSLRFIRRFHNRALTDDFLKLINQDVGILRILSRCRNEEYMDASMASANNAQDMAW